MKKRLFAGALALLMIIGLLPVSSMLKKPVEAQAADGRTYKYDYMPYLGENVTSVSKASVINRGNFIVYAKANAKITDSKKTFKINDNEEDNLTEYLNTNGKLMYDKKNSQVVGGVSFKTKGKCKVTVYYTTATTEFGVYTKNASNSMVAIPNNEKMTTSSIDSTDNQSTITCSEIEIPESNDIEEYYIGDTNGKISLYKIEVEEEYDYQIKVIDNKSSEETIKYVTEGDEVKFTAADKDNFLYWVNSRGKIVSRSETVSAFKVYYDDEYTAVYKTDAQTVTYMTYYNQEYVTMNVSDLEEAPAGPVRYGYEFNEWSMDVDAIKNSNESNVVVEPTYYDVTSTVEISVNGKTKSYVKNSEVEADATGVENFLYWYKNGDEKEIVSYNTKYYFLADENIKSVTPKTGTDVINKEGRISFITKYTDTNTNNKTFVFEFNVPDNAKILFAGIVASKGTDPTLSSYEYMRGKASEAQTFKYSWTKTNTTDTWHVMPVLKYMDDNGIHTITGHIQEN